MSNLISSSHIVQAGMLCMCVGLMFIGLAVAGHKAWAGESLFARDLDILTIQPVRSDAGRLFPYRFNAEVMLALSAEAAPVGTVFGHTPRLHIVVKPKQEVIWPANGGWQIAPDSDRVSLSPVLRFESEGARVEIKPQRHSIWFGWQKALP